ncbi:MAG: chemotaxis response regulator protein-glutamate methylesterase [Peptococcaceae bacterium]|nr:chemotaxis response regulator protein-glutamate methylesterase [Peptococcaceae bacterium]
MNSKKIRVLIADDSAFMRKVLSDILGADPALEVAATARNGREACDKARELKPDVLTLDVEMPVMDGLAALEEIMRVNPMPVVMLSALTQTGAQATMDALAKGAIDFISKPGGSISININDSAREIVSKVKMAARVNMKQIIPLAQTPSAPKIPAKAPVKASVTASAPPVKPAAGGEAGVARPGAGVRSKLPIVAIGTSTGGPKALNEMMRGLPGDLGAGVLIVQHMPAGFTKSLAQRLNSACLLTVKEAEDGEEVKRNCAYVAPGDYHLELKEVNRVPVVALSQKPPVNGHRPSVDVLMESVLPYQGRRVAVIMTGMGSDGAKGITELRKKGVVTIGESEETCVVYGMPKSAFQMGGIDYELPVGRIADAIARAVAKE